MSVQRYDLSGELYAADGGEWISYEDHVKSVNMAAMKAYAYMALNGNRDAAEKISQIILEAGR